MEATVTTSSTAKKIGSLTETQLCVLAHLGVFAGLVIPFGNLLAPFALLLFIGDKSEPIRQAAKESLNFQITASLALLIASVLCFAIIGFFILPLVALADGIFVAVAAVKTSEGKAYRYPCSIRLVS